MEYKKFKNGDKMPMMGIGTWQSDPEKLFTAIVEAVKYGYRHIDCAHIYANEEIVGDALEYLFKEKIVTREELWITSKLWNACHKQEQAIPALTESLRKLKLDYLDLYLVHWPVALKEGVNFPKTADEFYSLDEVSLLDTWRGMEDCLKSGKTRHIGVSNYSVKKLSGLLPQVSVKPEVNQVEMNPYLQQQELFDYCTANDICVTAFSPLGKGNIARLNDLNMFEDDVIKGIATKHNAPISHVLLSWGIKKGIVVIPKSVTPARIFENFDAVKLHLDEQDMKAMSAIDKDNRISFGGIWTDIEGSPYTQANLWD